MQERESGSSRFCFLLTSLLIPETAVTRCRLHAVTRRAQSLMIRAGPKQTHIAFVRFDVIDVRCRSRDAMAFEWIGARWMMPKVCAGVFRPLVIVAALTR
jgi:hypothetical protein